LKASNLAFPIQTMPGFKIEIDSNASIS